jgi:centromere-localized protein 2
VPADSSFQIFGSVDNLAVKRNHTLKSAVLEADSALQEVHTEVELLEQEAAALLALLGDIVSALSDLRYGKLGQPNLTGEVLEGLAGIDSACEIRQP